MTAPSLLPSLPPEGEPGSARGTLASRLTTPSLLPSLPPEGESGSARGTLASRLTAPSLLPSLPPEGEPGSRHLRGLEEKPYAARRRWRVVALS